MRHAAIGGGKRLRPLLTVGASRLFAIDRNRALRVGCAIEAIHVYSLIHDDLPCMDDADLRRGKATVHKAFGEATAVLAGDSLHALAFEILADPATHEDPWVRSDLVLELARAAGPAGMAGGQMMDLAAEGPAARPSGDHAPAAAEDRRADRICGRGRVHHGTSCRPKRGRPIAAMPATSASHSRSPTTSSTTAAMRRPPASPRAATPMRGRRPSSRCSAKSARASRPGSSSSQAIEHLSGHGGEADLLRAIARFAIERDH